MGSYGGGDCLLDDVVIGQGDVGRDFAGELVGDFEISVGGAGLIGQVEGVGSFLHFLRSPLVGRLLLAVGWDEVTAVCMCVVVGLFCQRGSCGWMGS